MEVPIKLRVAEVACLIVIRPPAGSLRLYLRGKNIKMSLKKVLKPHLLCCPHVCEYELKTSHITNHNLTSLIIIKVTCLNIKYPVPRATQSLLQ